MAGLRNYTAPLTAHFLVECIAVFILWTDPVAGAPGLPASHYWVARQYGAALAALNFVVGAALWHRNALAQAMGRYPQEARTIRLSTTLGIIVYHGACTLRALQRLHAGDVVDASGGAYVHLAVHGGFVVWLSLVAASDSLELKWE